MSPVCWKAKLNAAAGNKTIRPMSAFFGEVANMLRSDIAVSGRLELITNERGVHAIRIRRRRPISGGWLVPTLLLDATLDLELVRHFWPWAHLAADIRIETPHQRARQVVDRAFAKSSLTPLDEEQAAANPAEARKREYALARLHAILMREARRYAPGQVLVVAQKDVREALEARFPMRSNIVFGHHNAVRGIDAWRDVRAMVLVGRTQPSPEDVEGMAGALSGILPNRCRKWYPLADAKREMADGNVVAAEADWHPDPLAEAVRWQVCEGELEQILGRGRGVNRTADNPLDILVLTDVPLSVAINEILSDTQLAPTPIDRMLAASGVACMEPAHASRAHPMLWRSPEAARMAMKRAEEANILVYRIPYTGMFASSHVRYQLAGAGHKPAEALFDLDMVPSPRAWLEKQLGPLALFEISAPSTAPAAAAEDPGEASSLSVLGTATSSITTAPPAGPEMDVAKLPSKILYTKTMKGRAETATHELIPADIYDLGIIEPPVEHVLTVGRRLIRKHLETKPYPPNDPRAIALALRLAKAVMPSRYGLGFGRPLLGGLV